MTPPSRTAPDPAPANAGRLVEWHDAKGYGWIDEDGKRVFAHIKEFAPGQPRPQAGDLLAFTPGKDDRGRPRATAIRLQRQTGRIGAGTWLLLAALLVLPLLAGFRLAAPSWLVPAVMAAASLVAWFQYAADKRKALRGEWREQEFMLQMTAFYGGWPGALLAQRRFRHKTAKKSFQRLFWGIVALHQLVAADFVLDHEPARRIALLLLDAASALIDAFEPR